METKLTLSLDKSVMPADKMEIRRETLLGMAAKADISYDRPPESLRDLVNLRGQPILNLAAVAAQGGKSLSPDIQAFMNNGYVFYQANLGLNLGPATEYTFVRAQLTYRFTSDGLAALTLFDIFPQTTYEDRLKISGSVGLDLGLSYKISNLPLAADAKVKFAVEPQPWVWKVATIQSTGQGTLKARWLFDIDEKSASLPTSMVIMIKPFHPIPVDIGGCIEIDPGFLQRNYYYNIDPVRITLNT